MISALQKAALVNTSYTSPASTWLALFSVEPTVAYTSGTPTGTEISGNGYARINIPTASWNTPSGGTVSNSAAITFAASTGSWNSGSAIQYWGILDGSGAANLLYFDQLGLNDVQTLAITGSPTGGTFTISWSGQTTAAIAWNATAAAVESALEALSNIGEENVSVTGGPFPGTAMVITFTGTLARGPQALITTTNSFTGGVSPNTSITHTTTGITGSVTVNAANQQVTIAAGNLVITEN